MKFNNDLDFEAIKKTYTCASQINKLNDSGNSVLTLFLNKYYEKVDSLPKEEKTEIFEKDIIDRTILNDILSYFLNFSVDFNLYEEINEQSEPPLAVAVKYADYYMVKYLLTNNACPNLYTKKIVYNDNVFYTNRLLDLISKKIDLNDSLNLREIKKILLHFGAHEEI